MKDAHYFIPGPAMKFLKAQPYPTKYDRALNYLANMPSSSVRILAKETGSDAVGRMTLDGATLD